MQKNVKRKLMGILAFTVGFIVFVVPFLWFIYIAMR